MNKKTYFDTLRSDKPFAGRGFTQGQVEGIELIVEYWYKHHRNDPPEMLDYLLATAYHETAATMQPISEYGGNRYFRNRYDITGRKPHIAKALGNTEVGDGVKFKGRGHVMITGRRNYTIWSKRLGIDLVGNPDLALVPENSVKILVEGCLDGTFTGVGLGKYITRDRVDFRNARRVVNGTDKAKTIAFYATKFRAARKAATA